MTRNIYIMRHGDAAFTDGDDSQRTLSGLGIKQAQSVGVELKNEFFSTCWVSPYVRAQQTKDAVMESLGEQKEEITHKGITPYGNEVLIGEEIFSEEGDILLVSHMPFVSKLAHYLTGQIHSFYTADCAVIEIDGAKAKLKRVIRAS